MHQVLLESHGVEDVVPVHVVLNLSVLRHLLLRHDVELKGLELDAHVRVADLAVQDYRYTGTQLHVQVNILTIVTFRLQHFEKWWILSQVVENQRRQDLEVKGQFLRAIRVDLWLKCVLQEIVHITEHRFINLDSISSTDDQSACKREQPPVQGECVFSKDQCIVTNFVAHNFVICLVVLLGNCFVHVFVQLPINFVKFVLQQADQDVRQEEAI